MRRVPYRFVSTVLSVAALAVITAPAASAAVRELKQGDRIVFLGDSITAGGVREKGFVTIVSQTLAKQRGALGIEVIGAGISGNKVTDCQKRLQRDVLDRSPTVVVIYIGINDVWHWDRDAGTTKEDFEKGLQDLVHRCRDAGSHVILCTPSVIGEKTDGANRLDAMLDEYSNISRRVAEQSGAELLDLRARFLTQLKAQNPTNLEKGVLTTDGVHLNDAGNRFVADCMLAALGVGADTDSRQLRHVVLFKFKDDTTPEQLRAIVAAFASLPAKIDTIKDFECGTDVSVEGKADGFTHCFVVTFRDEAGRAAYLPHPAHAEFVRLAGPSIDKVLVFDYWVQR